MMTTIMFIGSFSNDEEDGSENVTIYNTSLFSKRGRDYFDRRKVSHVGEFPWNWIFGDSHQV